MTAEPLFIDLNGYSMQRANVSYFYQTLLGEYRLVCKDGTMMRITESQYNILCREFPSRKPKKRKH